MQYPNLDRVITRNYSPTTVKLFGLDNMRAMLFDAWENGCWGVYDIADIGFPNGENIDRTARLHDPFKRVETDLRKAYKKDLEDSEFSIWKTQK